MGKTPTRYLEIHPWKISENGYHPAQSQVSESLFSIANEYAGIRGFPEEGTTDRSLIGTYFNGLYVDAPEQAESGYRGITKKVHYMINAVNWVKTGIIVDGEPVRLAAERISDFRRELDLRTGELCRSYTWKSSAGTLLVFTFHRFLSMTDPQAAYQRLTVQALAKAASVRIDPALDFSIVHWGKYNFWNIATAAATDDQTATIGSLPNGQRLFSGYRLQTSAPVKRLPFRENQVIGDELTFDLPVGGVMTIDKLVTNLVDKNGTGDINTLWERGLTALVSQPSYDAGLAENSRYYRRLWDEIDIRIDGDEKDQQGIRFCLFQLAQTYHGYDPANNIGAKGLTGEAYSGHAFWDTETYCLPFYLFSDPQAARNLLLFRYATLPMAKERAKELDLRGACYPIATLNGHESCALWQHASLQPQPSTAIAFAIDHYVRNTGDEDFLTRYGLEMLIEISRYLLSRGDYNPDGTKFGFFGVMGPDEFQMMVNHNAYTNYMGMATFDTTLKALTHVKKTDPDGYRAILAKTGLKPGEIKAFREAMEKTFLPYDPKTRLFEQHQGYFGLPHVDIKKIPERDFPLYAHWSYDRIYRNDMIKQPDVLMFLFLYNSRFSLAVKRANYEFYEPRCIHESSLSPSIHSVLAAELDKDAEAAKFFEFATRMDLDDFNRNASEGLHLTSIAAAWVNIVYGFGGLRSDGGVLRLAPKLPPAWKGYSFHLAYRHARLHIEVTSGETRITADRDLDEPLVIEREKVWLKAGTTVFTR